MPWVQRLVISVTAESDRASQLQPGKLRRALYPGYDVFRFMEVALFLAPHHGADRVVVRSADGGDESCVQKAWAKAGSVVQKLGLGANAEESREAGKDYAPEWAPGGTRPAWSDDDHRKFLEGVIHLSSREQPVG